MDPHLQRSRVAIHQAHRTSRRRQLVQQLARAHQRMISLHKAAALTANRLLVHQVSLLRVVQVHQQVHQRRSHKVVQQSQRLRLAQRQISRRKVHQRLLRSRRSHRQHSQLKVVQLINQLKVVVHKGHNQ